MNRSSSYRDRLGLGLDGLRLNRSLDYLLYLLHRYLPIVLLTWETVNDSGHRNDVLPPLLLARLGSQTGPGRRRYTIPVGVQTLKDLDVARA